MVNNTQGVNLLSCPEAIRHIAQMNEEGIGILAEGESIPCGRQGFAISKASLSSDQPKTLRCGEEDLLCNNCFSLYSQAKASLEENGPNHPHTASPSVSIDISEESEDEAPQETGVMEKIKSALSTPQGKLGAAAITSCLAAAAGYGMYRLLTESSIDIAERSLDNDAASESDAVAENTDEMAINNIHLSAAAVVEEFDLDSSAKADVLLSFPSQNCKEQIKEDLHLQNGDISWENENADVQAIMAPMNRTSFIKALGTAVKRHDCIKSLSVETLTSTTMQQKITSINEQNRVKEQVKTLFEAVNDNNEQICVSLNPAGKGKIGFNPIQCRPKATSYIRPSKEMLKSGIGIEAQKSCVGSIGLISDVIGPDSDVGASVRTHIHFENEVKNVTVIHDSNTDSAEPSSAQTEPRAATSTAEQYARSALTRCPDLKFDVCQASLFDQVEDGNLNPLSSHKVIKCLDHFLAQENKPDKIVIMEPNEMADYQPSSSLINDLAKNFMEKGSPVAVYDASPGAWGGELQSVQQVETVNEAIQKPPEPLDIAVITASTFGALSAAMATGGAVGYCYYRHKQKREERERNSAATAIELERRRQAEETAERETLLRPYDPNDPRIRFADEYRQGYWRKSILLTESEAEELLTTPPDVDEGKKND